jgi:hypothetical protein
MQRGPAAFAGPDDEANLCQGADVLIDQLVGRIATQVKADRMYEDGTAAWQ